MKLDFAKNMKRNVASSALNNGVRLLFPFLNRTLFLWLLGPAYLGLNGLFGSVLGVLMLAELGFGYAVISAMYKPVAEDNHELTCAYLLFFRTVYRWVGAVIFFGGLCLLPFLKSLIHGYVPPDIDLHILYVIHLVNAAASYFFFAYRGSVLSIHHRNDVLDNIRTFTSVLQYVVVFLILLLTRNYYLYVVATVLFTVDNIVISVFLGLVAVAAYGNYYYVVTSVAGMVSIIYKSVLGGFGNKIHTETKEENFRLFMKMVRITQICILWSSAMMAALYQPFISAWTKGDPTLMRHALTPVLMILYFYVNQSRQMLLSFKAAAALWKQDRWKPIVSSLVNLAFNFAFVIWLPDAYKLDGVILSTIISYVAIQVPWEAHVVFKCFFNGGQARVYWWMHVRFALLTVVFCAIAWDTARLIPFGGLGGVLSKAALVAAVTIATLIMVFPNDLQALRRRKVG